MLDVEIFENNINCKYIFSIVSSSLFFYIKLHLQVILFLASPYLNSLTNMQVLSDDFFFFVF